MTSSSTLLAVNPTAEDAHPLEIVNVNEVDDNGGAHVETQMTAGTPPVASHSSPISS